MRNLSVSGTEEELISIVIRMLGTTIEDWFGYYNYSMKRWGLNKYQSSGAFEHIYDSLSPYDSKTLTADSNTARNMFSSQGINLYVH